MAANLPSRANMPEEELVARIKELANDPKRRTGSAQMFPHPVARRAVEDAETRMGFQLPALLKRLWTEVGNGGFGPGYGLFGVNLAPSSELSMSIPNVYLQSVADESYGWPKNLVLVCEWGCANYSAVDCSTPEGEIVNVSGEMDLKPTRSSFAQWMQDWVDGVDLWRRDFSDHRPVPTGTET
ncbi:MAG: SMI1/KNR4 family protein [Bryobacteraceae bacterium]